MSTLNHPCGLSYLQEPDEVQATGGCCKDGKRHWWKAGFVCEKCGVFRSDHEAMKRKLKTKKGWVR